MRGLTFLSTALLAVLSSTTATAQTASPAENGNLYVASVLENLGRQGSIAAKLRYESHLQNQSLVGLGEYWQRGDLNKRLTRWEMQTQIDDQIASFVQVYDGDHLWTDLRLPSQRAVRRLDVAWLQAKLRAANRGVDLTTREQLIAAAEGQGGLSQMLSDLLRNFNFQAPQPTQLDGLPVYAVIGQWRPDQLERLWPGADNNARDWPAHVPHHVLLLVGSNFFPYLCEHRSAHDASLATSLSGRRPTNEPLLRYEVFDVNFAVAIPAEKFDYNPGNADWTDETERVLEQLKIAREMDDPITTATNPRIGTSR